MRGPIAALLWEIWRQHRLTLAAIAALTVASWFVDPSSAVATLLGMLAFVLLFAVFNYTESAGGRGVGQFPRRLFTLPVTSLRLVAIPILTGIAAVAVLDVLWLGTFSGDGSASPWFVIILLAAFMVFYLAVLWTCERAGALRLVLVGVTATAVFVMSLMPSIPPTPPPGWRSEAAVAAAAAALATIAFLLTWARVAQLRVGGAAGIRHDGSLFTWIAGTLPARRRTFTSPAAAQFWFEWRASGMALPAVVAVALALIAPLGWVVRSNADDTFRIVRIALAAPIVLAIPVGMAFSKPTFWSESLGLPAFVAVRPLSSEDLVATKVKVAAVSAVLSWLVVLVFLAVWLLPSGANLDELSQFAIQLWAFHGQSRAAVYGIAALVVLAGMFLTWRLLVSRLWSGLAGSRPIFVASVIVPVALVIAGMVFDAGRLPDWLLDDPARLGPVAWIAAVAVIAKYWLAAYAWRDVPGRYLRAYLPMWLAATASFLALGLVAWGIVRIYLPIDVDRLRSIVILLALLAVPIARVGLAPSRLARNRHR